MLSVLQFLPQSYSYVTFKAKVYLPFDEGGVIILITRLLRPAYSPSNSTYARGITL
jgi:hypothetical protein